MAHRVPLTLILSYDCCSGLGTTRTKSLGQEPQSKRKQEERLEMSSEGRVCVTGGSGFIGSWVIRLLLERGYTVHATVKDLNDEGETKHLLGLDGASQRLRLFQIDLLDYTSILAAVQGTTGVFHLASPNRLSPVQDPQRELLDPAEKGTLNVLRAAQESRVRRVVVTSSMAAIFPNPSWPAGMVYNEDSWTDVDYCKKLELWYPVSKTLAERAAWEFAAKERLDVVVINPAVVLGPVLPPSINDSVAILLHLLQGREMELNNLYIGCVDVRDVALAHILLFEKPLAQGRHPCVEAITRWCDFVAKVAELYPEFKVPRHSEDKQPWLVRAESPSKKLMELGLHFRSMEQMIKNTVESLKGKGYL
ncbi:phenylacetaldehyde reductase-like [Phoenix dactylifera]|uniref:Phenylacetaldehyde reductase-like n=1 Tax=Phoenix dactylifera TaxID=42345 RepID=A0A8B7C5I6_PHODC|nr:phenylacetaldehyde reductase-like [Phoenix dactylifera]